MSAKIKPAPVTGDRVRSYIERVERLLGERSAISDDIRDVFSEAKGVGYDVKTLRKLIQIRAMDAADRAEQEALLDTYAHAIGIEVGAGMREPTEDELLERAGRVVGEVDRCMVLVRDGKPPKIEAIKTLIECSTGKAHKLRGMVERRIAYGFSRSITPDRENENSDPTTGELIETGGDQPDPRKSTSDASGPTISGEQPPSSESPLTPGVTSESCGGTPSDRASETLEATVSEGSEVLISDDAGTAQHASLGPALTDVASRCEPGPQDPPAEPDWDELARAQKELNASVLRSRAA